MKKFMKFMLWLVAICGAVAVAMYFIKNILMKDYMDDYDDEDFDNDFYDDDDAEDRGYVTINSSEDEEEASEEENDD